MITVLRQGCVVSVIRSASQDTPHNSSAELYYYTPSRISKWDSGNIDTAMAVWELHVTGVLTARMPSFLRWLLWVLRKLCFVRISGITWGHGRAWGSQILGNTIPRTGSPKWAILERLQ